MDGLQTKNSNVIECETQDASRFEGTTTVYDRWLKKQNLNNKEVLLKKSEEKEPAKKMQNRVNKPRVSIYDRWLLREAEKKLKQQLEAERRIEAKKNVNKRPVSKSTKNDVVIIEKNTSECIKKSEYLSVKSKSSNGFEYELIISEETPLNDNRISSHENSNHSADGEVTQNNTYNVTKLAEEQSGTDRNDIKCAVERDSDSIISEPPKCLNFLEFDKNRCIKNTGGTLHKLVYSRSLKNKILNTRKMWSAGNDGICTPSLKTRIKSWYGEDEELDTDWAKTGTWPSHFTDSSDNSSYNKNNKKNLTGIYDRWMKSRKKQIKEARKGIEQKSKPLTLNARMISRVVSKNHCDYKQDFIQGVKFTGRWVQEQDSYVALRLDSLAQGRPAEDIDVTPWKYSDLLNEKFDWEDHVALYVGCEDD